MDPAPVPNTLSLRGHHSSRELRNVLGPPPHEVAIGIGPLPVESQVGLGTHPLGLVLADAVPPLPGAEGIHQHRRRPEGPHLRSTD